MKKLLIGVIVLAALMLAGVAMPPAAVAGSPEDAPDAVMARMFEAHKDFPCVAAFKANVSAKFTGARIAWLDAFALEKKLDADKVQCFWWTWLFDRDVNATHYIKRGGINNFDRAVLFYRDLNEVVYELSGQPMFNTIRDSTDRPAHQWKRYPTEMIAE